MQMFIMTRFIIPVWSWSWIWNQPKPEDERNVKDDVDLKECLSVLPDWPVWRA